MLVFFIVMIITILSLLGTYYLKKYDGYAKQYSILWFTIIFLSLLKNIQYWLYYLVTMIFYILIANYIIKRI